MSRGSRRKRREDRFGGLLILFVVIAVLAGAYFYYQAMSREMPLNPDNMCPKDGPHSIAVVLIDATDPLDAVQREDVSKLLDDIKNNIPRYGEIELFTVAPSDGSLLVPELAVCNPGRGTDTSELYGNPRLMEKRWQTAFAAKTDEVLKRLLTSRTVDTSPILESIQQVAVQTFVGQRAGAVPKQLIIVSDMLQNTAALSQYRGIESFGEFRQAPYYMKLRPNLSGVDVTVFYLRRLNAAHLQGRRHIEFWQEYFQDAGATLVDVKSIEG